ncbi:PREDICTED: uncharacterized protein LOC104808387 [Tarenaya hassleriana]|uniref:uncharacterized protein LOC104808387 n=1 Tax=Tarenaya hassleriana TaxID=28532 RepID=UPI00053C8393|nr:PREDICTED: uncharacterized protein LOC104808387 [Tarenaya hassleriana]
MGPQTRIGARPDPPSSSPVGVAWWHRIRHEDRWWTRAILKLREWSEIVAGPRWKTFIRRFNRSNHLHGGGDRDRHGNGQFQYDALSYALNFDEGPVVEDGGVADEDRAYGGFRSFSTRYAAVPPSNKKTIAGGGGQMEVGRLVA